jgi:hypothetical protein
MLVEVGDEWHVVGVAAWKRAQVNGTDIYPGKYGETSYGLRLGHYADGIEATIKAASTVDGAR